MQFFTSWWPLIEKKGLIKEAARQGRGQTITQLEDWLISNPNDLVEGQWDLVSNAPSDAQRRQLALKLWLAPTAN